MFNTDTEAKRLRVKFIAIAKLKERYIYREKRKRCNISNFIVHQKSFIFQLDQYYFRRLYFFLVLFYSSSLPRKVLKLSNFHCIKINLSLMLILCRLRINGPSNLSDFRAEKLKSDFFVKWIVVMPRVFLDLHFQIYINQTIYLRSHFFRDVFLGQTFCHTFFVMFLSKTTKLYLILSLHEEVESISILFIICFSLSLSFSLSLPLSPSLSLSISFLDR